VLQPEERWVLQRFVPAEGVDPALAALAARLARVAPGVRVRGQRRCPALSSKGRGFDQPDRPHEHWQSRKLAQDGQAGMRG